MVIMIAGPYRHGSSNPDDWKKNHEFLNRVAFDIFQRGHIPLIGVNAALPVIEVNGKELFDELMMPICLGLAEKCDAVLRVGGASAGADREVEVFRKMGLPVYYSEEEVPGNTSNSGE